MPNLLRHTCQYLAVAVLVALAGASQAQDPVFSQFYASPLLLNPAFAGTTQAPHIALHHRSQYLGFASQTVYQSYAASYSQYVAPIRSGIGLSVFADDAGGGGYLSYAARAYYSYQVRIDKSRSIRVGLSAGLQRRELDWDRLVFGDQLNNITGLDPSLVTNEVRPDDTNITFADFGAGLLYAGKTAYFGASLDHVTQPDDQIAFNGPGGFYRGLPMRFSTHAGVQLPIGGTQTAGKPNFVTPNVLYTLQGPFAQLNAGAYASFNVLFVGGWFRYAFGNSDAFIGVVGVEWDMYKFGYSYDLTVNGLSNETSGTHEVSLQLNFDKAWWIQKKRKATRYNDCLQLFR